VFACAHVNELPCSFRSACSEKRPAVPLMPGGALGAESGGEERAARHEHGMGGVD
jgi:hypothetical protein